MIKFLCGTEPYLIDFNKKQISEGLNYKDLNVYISEHFDRQCYDICMQYPVFDDFKVVYLQLDDFKEDELLLQYISYEVSTTNLVITAKQYDKSSKLFKKLKSIDAVFEFNKCDLKTLDTFILKQIKECDGNITSDAFHLLKSRLGYIESDTCSLYTVKTIIKQLLFADKDITYEVVEGTLEKTLNENSFAISKYLINKDATNLFSLLDYLILNKENALGILSLVLRNFRLAYKVAISSEKNSFKEIGITTFQLGDYKNLSPKVINTCIDIIQKFITRLKKGSKDHIVLRLCFSQLLAII